MITWSGRACCLNAVATGAITFQVEAVGETSPEVFEVGVGGEGDAVLGANVGWGGCGAGGVLIDDGEGVLISTVVMTAAQFEADHGSGEGEAVVDVFCGADAVLDADIGLIKDVPSAEVPGACLADGKVEFKLAYAKVERVGR